ncbi:hypothetical protein CSB20_14315 [bacterium DOLZORAL124_64_63]|nr:MAG: hypothetical protein CSB20_14315 [bacterium DOLZORAL124_64_63]
MRYFFLFLLMLACVGSAIAFDLGNQYQVTKTNSHVMMNPGTPDSRQGGETVADAFVITTLPFNDVGNTTDNVDDYDVACPYSGSTSPDVVYSYTPAADEFIRVDLCGSGYDTKTYVIDGDMNLIACNEDFYYGDPDCGHFTSCIEMASLTGGVECFIVIDGYGGDAGDYILSVQAVIPPEPCVVECNGDVEEGEPELVSGYLDVYNSGCNDNTGLYPFQFLDTAHIPKIDFCGVSGWYDEARDTDWFIAVLNDWGMLTWTLDAEEETYGFLLGGDVAGCGNDITVEEFMTAGPCAPAEIEIWGIEGDTLFLWIGPTDYIPPMGFTGNEYDYAATFLGPQCATTRVSLDSIKCLYR